MVSTPIEVREPRSLRTVDRGTSKWSFLSVCGLVVASLAVLGACTPDPAPPTVVQVRSNGGHTCAMVSNQTVACWGMNDFGQLGSATNAGTTSVNPHPAVVAQLSKVTQVALGRQHSCALLSDRTVSCWGNNRYGQLGNPAAAGTGSVSFTPTSVVGLTGAVSVAAYYDHTCAVLVDATVSCWGSNTSGELGTTTNVGTTLANPSPVTVAGLSNVVALSLGESHSCALRDDQTVACWGWNRYGQLGNSANSGTGGPNPFPLPVTGLTDVRALASGDEHTCAVQASGAVSCWGMNTYGQLGTPTGVGSTDPQPVPTTIAGLGGVTAIGGGNFHTCGILSDGGLTCWGMNVFGQLATPAGPPVSTPSAATGAGPAEQVTGGAGFTCSRRTDAKVMCWGYNRFGQAGNTTANGTDDPNPTPVLVTGL